MTRQLIIGNKNYSSWSLRPWLFMRFHNISFQEVRIPLYAVNSRERILKYSPSGLVPALVDGDLHVWDSLAICEYVSEAYLDRRGWPQDIKQRAHARAISAEMHSGFARVREHFSMNVRARFQWQAVSDPVERELQRLFEIWEQCLGRDRAGPWLFGDFSIADAMYAPVCLRLDRYNVPVSPTIKRYVDQMLSIAPMQDWCETARSEKEIIGWAENSVLLRLED